MKTFEFNGQTIQYRALEPNEAIQGSVKHSDLIEMYFLYIGAKNSNKPYYVDSSLCYYLNEIKEVDCEYSLLFEDSGNYKVLQITDVCKPIEQPAEQSEKSCGNCYYFDKDFDMIRCVKCKDFSQHCTEQPEQKEVDMVKRYFCDIAFILTEMTVEAKNFKEDKDLVQLIHDATDKILQCFAKQESEIDNFMNENQIEPTEEVEKIAKFLGVEFIDTDEQHGWFKSN